jgi:hypothetical protein
MWAQNNFPLLTKEASSKISIPLLSVLEDFSMRSRIVFHYVQNGKNSKVPAHVRTFEFIVVSFQLVPTTAHAA